MGNGHTEPINLSCKNNFLEFLHEVHVVLEALIY